MVIFGPFLVVFCLLITHKDEFFIIFLDWSVDIHPFYSKIIKNIIQF